ncbi:LCP family protein [Streptomyces sp. F63]|uniref:LCP family protein n=1 Tax=Streptomyces sp. F63 TaxID=2824887 RepID=UPI001B35F3C6|nr:LCP family protein [Streptomyces sp. F63]MBQ0987892.1 LCP family protein [Streptomyces sp. F63]
MFRPALPLRTRRPRSLTAGVLCAAVLAGGCAQWSRAPEPPARPGPEAAAPRVSPFEGVTGRPRATPGTTFLLVGLDRRTGISREDKRRLFVGGEGCDCTDVMMLLHVSEDRRRVSVISIPRDSYTEFPPHTEPPATGTSATGTSAAATSATGTRAAEPPAGEPPVTDTPAAGAPGPAASGTGTSGPPASPPESPGTATSGTAAAGAVPSGSGGGPVRHWGKINAAHKHGGPALTVAAVEGATGIRIDHYLETDFTGFVRTVDRLGGGRVCTGKPLKDKNSGLDLPPGTHHVDGTGALKYVRARKLDPPGDLGRVRRQQRFLLSVMENLLSGERAAAGRDGLSRSARALLASVRTDEGLTLPKLAGLGRALRKLPTSAAEFATVPIRDFDHRVPGWGSTLVWDEPRAEALFAAVRADRPIVPETRPGEVRPVPVAIAPRKLRVRVAEGPGAEPGSAARLARELRAAGFTVVGVTAGSGGGAEQAGPTEIAHDPRLRRAAPTLSAALPNARVREVKGLGRVFRVTVGPIAGRVVPVVHDRSGVEGAPVTGDELSCREAPPGG